MIDNDASEILKTAIGKMTNETTDIFVQGLPAILVVTGLGIAAKYGVGLVRKFLK